MKKLMSFAQDAEDLILFSFLDEIKNGFYVDVGANDPWKGSITKLFYDLGWNGINIEPLPDMYNALVEDRKRDINVNLGAGDKEGILDLFVSEGCSTFDNDNVLNTKEVISVKVKKLNDIISENIEITNTEIHFCKIDVENFEKQVLLGLNLDKIRPWIFCIESTLPLTKIPTYKSWENILLDNNYYLLCSKGVNRYYADKSKKDLFDKKIKNYITLKEKYDIFYALNKNTKPYKILKHIDKTFYFFTDKYYRIKYKKF